ncbi:unnamed protein product [Rotaria sp. Silwood1]|nr:unnamed protein product [Rotaria sp. Silwood1]CAF4905329.1 unnamed protein product [Rotaria sp. Silwood1]
MDQDKRTLTFNQSKEDETKEFQNDLSITCIEDLPSEFVRRWERLILRYLPQLEKFNLECFAHVDGNPKYPIYSTLPNQFNASFWIKRQWILETEIFNRSIKYLVCPYRKRWYDDTQNKTFDSPVEFSKLTRLTVRSIRFRRCYQEAMVAIRRLSSVAQIYHLVMLKENFLTDALIEIMKLLPDLSTLKIRSLSLDQPTRLSFEESIIFDPTKFTSKITKAYLEKMNDIEQFYFLLELCPHMIYFKMNYLADMDIQHVLRCIITRIHYDRNDHLRLLCFRIPTTDNDDIIKKLEKMIIVEKLLLSYRIKRVLDNVYIEWK